jgi:hypothetical protein
MTARKFKLPGGSVNVLEDGFGISHSRLISNPFRAGDCLVWHRVSRGVALQQDPRLQANDSWTLATPAVLR